MPSNKELTFTTVGQGIQVADDGTDLIVKVSRDQTQARLSSTGKMKLTASTGGWLTIPGMDLRLMLNAGVKNAG